MTAPRIEAQLGEGYGDFSAILAAWAEAQGTQVALRDDAMALTWHQLTDQVERIAARLIETGLQRGQSVAILGTSTIAYALVFLAAVRAGGVAAPLTTSASANQLAEMVKDSGTRHVFIDQAKADELGPDFAASCDRIQLEDLAQWMAQTGTKAPVITPRAGDPFNIIYSSGTTGVPKGIVHSHQMRWVQFAPTAASYLKQGNAVRALASTPLYSNTTMVSFLSTLLSGGCVTIMGKFSTKGWLEHAQRERITHTMLVPVQYQRLMAEPAFHQYDLSALRLKYCTSAPFAPELKAQVLERMPGGLIEIYGMTEGGVTCLLYAHEHKGKLHTVGTPAPGHSLKVLGDNDQELPPGESGNLIGRSPAMMLGYKNREESTRKAQWTNPEDGSVWMRMGDIGRIDADGFVELVGRAKDMIISGGFNIYPSDLEAVLQQEPEVVEAGVVGAVSQAWGETPVGFVTLHADAKRSLEDIRMAANTKLGKTQRLAALYPLNELPRSHIGKLLKTELRALAAEQYHDPA